MPLWEGRNYFVFMRRQSLKAKVNSTKVGWIFEIKFKYRYCICILYSSVYERERGRLWRACSMWSMPMPLFNPLKKLYLSLPKYNLCIREIYCFANQIICQTWVNSRTTPQILFIWLEKQSEGREKRKAKAKAEAEAKTERSNELNCKKQTTIF